MCNRCRGVVTATRHRSSSLATNSNLLLQELTVPAGEEWVPPAAAWWFVRIVDGAAYWLGKPRPIALEKGMLLLLPGTATVTGCIRSSQINPTRLAYFAFIPDDIVGVFTVTDRAQVSLPAGPAVTAPRAYPPDSSFAQELASLTGGRTLSTSLIFRCQLLGFAVRVLNECEPVTGSNAPAAATGNAPVTDVHGVNQRLTVLVRRLADADLVRLSGEELAIQCGCSVRHFRRLFRKVMGVSLQYRQSELRMLKARQMLIESDLPIVEVSKACGFHHQSLFHAMFKTWFGMTPGQWRTRERAGKSTVEV